MSIGRVAMVVHTGNSKGVALQAKLEAWLSERGVEVTDDRPDLVVSLGGDGTMLRAARLAHEADAPLLGVNFGSLGYLTEVDPGGELEALERIFAADFTLEERLMLSCRVDGRGEDVGLNEVLIERSSHRRLVRLEVRIGGEPLAAFNADGVMVATPTGSTAYALSAGGPIVDPRAQCLLLVPVSPHMIFSRPFVLGPDQVVEIIVREEGRDATLSLDGARGCDIPSGTSIVVHRHQRALQLVKLSGPRFIERLRTKLNLPG
ncbi:MAG: NAD(+)/NADH kinase [Actinobacteria bacterium]|nr:NAD(+)/NADH kinase [Actinomycetota bacterium]